MLENSIAYEDVISPAVTAQMRRTVRDLEKKVGHAARVQCSIRHMTRDSYEVVVSLRRDGSDSLVMARKEGKNVYAELKDAAKAILRQVFSQKEKLKHERFHDLPFTRAS